MALTTPIRLKLEKGGWRGTTLVCLLRNAVMKSGRPRGANDCIVGLSRSQVEHR